MPKPAEARSDRHVSAVPNAGDLAVAGAIPATFVANPAITDGGGLGMPSYTAKPAAPGQIEGGQAHDIAAAQPTGGSGGLAAQSIAFAPPGTIAGSVPAADAATASPATFGHAAMIAPFVPMPYGAGAPDVVAMAQAASAPLPDLPAGDQVVLNAAPAMAAVPAGVIDVAALDAVRTSVATLQDTLAALADRLPDATAAAQPTLDAAQALVTQTLDGAQVQVGATIAAVATTVEQTTDHISVQLNDAVAAAGAAATTLTAPVLDSVADTTAAITAQVDDIAAEVVNPVTALLDEGFAGHDPASGITTLVSMVSAADAFGLPDAAMGDGEALVPALGALGAADLLADVAPIDVLLGVNDHHESHGLADIDGLFGHG